MRATEDLDAVIVGGGPRAVATALRTAARRIAAGLSPARLAIVDALAVSAGSGPRAGAPALRSAAWPSAAGISPARLAIVEALAVGSGATWLIDQPAQYLNNTQADATTVHPVDSTRMTGPAAPGPDLID